MQAHGILSRSLLTLLFVGSGVVPAVQANMDRGPTWGDRHPMVIDMKWKPTALWTVHGSGGEQLNCWGDTGQRLWCYGNSGPARFSLEPLGNGSYNQVDRNSQLMCELKHKDWSEHAPTSIMQITFIVNRVCQNRPMGTAQIDYYR